MSNKGAGGAAAEKAPPSASGPLAWRRGDVRCLPREDITDSNTLLRGPSTGQPLNPPTPDECCRRQCSVHVMPGRRQNAAGRKKIRSAPVHTSEYIHGTIAILQ
jgi:hypothetical protein